MPKLISRTENRGFKIHEDFEWIIKNFPSRDVLRLLRDNWDLYSPFFDPEKLVSEEMKL